MDGCACRQGSEGGNITAIAISEPCLGECDRPVVVIVAGR